MSEVAVHIDPNLQQAIERGDASITAICMMRAERKLSAAEIRHQVLELIDRVRQQVGSDPFHFQSMKVLPSFIITASAPFMRALLACPEIVSSGADAEFQMFDPDPTKPQ
ncbi:MAG: hypothetical protein Q7R83_02025 [bacterium]|nr:hypothetical protein [bacterium]